MSGVSEWAAACAWHPDGGGASEQGASERKSANPVSSGSVRQAQKHGAPAVKSSHGSPNRSHNRVSLPLNKSQAHSLRSIGAARAAETRCRDTQDGKSRDRKRTTDFFSVMKSSSQSALLEGMKVLCMWGACSDVFVSISGKVPCTNSCMAPFMRDIPGLISLSRSLARSLAPSLFLYLSLPLPLPQPPHPPPPSLPLSPSLHA